MQRAGVAGHFQRGIDPFTGGDLANRGGDGFGAFCLCVQNMVDADLFGQAEAIVADVRGDNGCGPGGACHGGGKQAGRPAAGDQHRVTGEIFDQCRIDRVAERFLNGRELRWNGGRSLPQDIFRQHDIFRERSVAIDAEDAIIPADVRLAGPALKTPATGDVRFRRDVVTYFDQRDGGADFHDLTAHFMADDTGRVDAAMSPGIPIIDVGVSAAERGGLHADDGVVRSGSRIRAGGGDQPGFRRHFHKSPHASLYNTRPILPNRGGRNGLHEGPRPR